jgi:hypothetical protein
LKDEEYLQIMPEKAAYLNEFSSIIPCALLRDDLLFISISSKPIIYNFVASIY